jgi:hypothetical protein
MFQGWSARKAHRSLKQLHVDLTTLLHSQFDSVCLEAFCMP